MIQVTVNVTLSRLYRVLGDFRVSIDTLMQNISLLCWYLPLFHWRSGSRPGCHLRQSRVPRANAFFHTSLRIAFSKCHQTLKQIAVGSPLGAANYIFLLCGATSLKRLRSTALALNLPMMKSRWTRC